MKALCAECGVREGEKHLPGCKLLMGHDLRWFGWDFLCHKCGLQLRAGVGPETRCMGVLRDPCQCKVAVNDSIQSDDCPNCEQPCICRPEGGGGEGNGQT